MEMKNAITHRESLTSRMNSAEDKIPGPKAKEEDLDQISIGLGYGKAKTKQTKRRKCETLWEINKPSHYRHTQGRRILSQ